MSGTFLRFVIFMIALWPVLGVGQELVFEDSMAERTRACSHCHGKQGRAGPDGYYPRLAGKPAAYLYNQLRNFREGRRHYSLMTGLLEPLTDAYLMEMAQYFAGLNLPYPPPTPVTATTPTQLARGRTLVMQGDPRIKIPACTNCHGDRLTGALPHVPGLLGLPRDYLNAQLGGWQTGQRRAHGPDCMATIAARLDRADVSAISHWLAAQTVPADSRPQAQAPAKRATGQADASGCGSAPAPLPSAPAASSSSAPTDLQGRGAYLARVGNCQGCHTATGGDNYAGGRGIETPFGTVYTSNLTTDRDSGIGAWSPSDFWQAMHEGRSKDQRLLYPAFPYPSFTQLSRADVDALFAFLKTVPAVKQTNKPHALRWPYRTQTALALWRGLYFTPGGVEGASGTSSVASSVASRGADLVNGLAHCGTCHTPRNMLGASRSSLDLQGGMLPMQGWYAPSLLDRQEGGVGGWSLDEVSRWLQTGVSARGVATGPMAQVVLHSTQYLSDDDRLAMASYLRASQRPSAVPDSGTKLAAGDPRSSGAGVYEAMCKSCHGGQGQGVPGAYPALAGNRTVTMPNPNNLIQTILWGGYTPATAGNPRPFGMPPFVLNLSDRELAALTSHLRSAWGNRSEPVTALEVKQAREKP